MQDEKQCPYLQVGEKCPYNRKYPCCPQMYIDEQKIREAEHKIKVKNVIIRLMIYIFVPLFIIFCISMGYRSK